MALFSGFEGIMRTGEPMAMHTWFQLGGPAEYFAEPETRDELSALVRRCHEEDLPVRLLGEGSNILVRDEGVRGMVVRLSAPAFCRIVDRRPPRLPLAAALLGRAVTAAVHHGLAGLETLIGIPGTVGGALHGNAGSRSGSIGQWTLDATVLGATGEISHRGSDELGFGYRQSKLEELVILEAGCELEEDDPRTLGPTDAKAVDHPQDGPADGQPVHRLHLQESPRPERRRDDRQGRLERHAHRRRGGEQPPRQLHHRRARVHRPGRAPADRDGPRPDPRPRGRRAGIGTRGMVARSREGPLWIAAAAIILFAVGVCAAWQMFGRKILGSGEYLVGRDQVEVTPPPPDWIHGDVPGEALRDAAIDGPLSVTDGNCLERVARAFARHPWVAKVVRVQKRYPASLTVDLVYRRPVCMVEAPGGPVPVDAEAVVLPRQDFSPVEATHYPHLAGIGQRPTVRAGEHWADATVLGGAEIAAAVLSDWERLGLHAHRAGRRRSGPAVGRAAVCPAHPRRARASPGDSHPARTFPANFRPAKRSPA